MAKRVNFDFGYTLNLVNGDNLDAYNYGMNSDQFSYVHVGLSFQIGNPKTLVKTVKPNKSIIREPLRNKADAGPVKDSLVKATDGLKAKQVNETAGITSKPGADSDGDGVW
ncbi:hypothetical protein [Pedobacter rhodius]|uniref:Outer membrane protein beta-barrel domain-containing protein n=1 Tax=Pedobacter rhodius TaxID=3004098 RepID=A0ABT4KSD0_9SPHI|nr:hypothetical protein [Pedobacter sp. SJ11]MCZ4221820.1 hypothetical protein [Pedobacter sp. SJ11]